MLTDSELIAQARVRAYLARRAIASGYDPEYIHGFDIGKDNPEGISLTVPDLTALLDALEAARAERAKAVDRAIATLAEIKGGNDAESNL